MCYIETKIKWMANTLSKYSVIKHRYSNVSNENMKITNYNVHPRISYWYLFFFNVFV